MSKLPNFLIIGAAKSGTTSLFYYLKRHPYIFFPSIKELNFFSYDPGDLTALVRPGIGPGDRYATEWTGSLTKYQLHFLNHKPPQLAGEASVSYLYSPLTPQNLGKLIPDVKLIVMLRNPVERAWSHYLHMVRDGREELSFDEALKAERERIDKGWEFSWHYCNMGFYGQQLSLFLERFPRDSLKVVMFDDFKANPLRTTNEVLEFLGLPADYPLETKGSHNKSGLVRSKLLARLLNRPTAARLWVKRMVPQSLGHAAMERLRQMNLQSGKAEMPTELRIKLQACYLDDINYVEELIGRDLSAWRMQE